MWRFLLYSVFCAMGAYILFYPKNAIWVDDTRHHWVDWPNHPLSDSLVLFYNFQIGSYIHQLFWTEVTRSDALEMIIHHIVTLCLLVCSYLANFTRVGTSIVLIHDSADIFLESAKVFNYISKAKDRQWAQRWCDGLFGTFAVVFFITRLVLYPRFMIYSVLVESIDVFGANWRGYYWFNGLLIILQILHIFWFYTIARMIFKLVTNGGIEKDERSDDDEDVDGSDDKPRTKIASKKSN